MTQFSEYDTIVAPVTPLQLHLPVAIIRLSGPQSKPIWTSMFSKPEKLKPRYMAYGNVCDDRGVVDDVTCVYFPAPHSYTGQDVVEIFPHGNPVIVQAILDQILKAGARMAQPGEFTQRALLNGKMDLIQAEGVHELIQAKTRYHADMVRRQSSGPLNQFAKGCIDDVLKIQAHIEASIDYGEEDVDALEDRILLQKMQNLQIKLQSVASTKPFVLGLRKGFRVLLTGPPNAGKSTLFNRLVGSQRALVSDLPGTTRDFISEEISLHGLPVVLIDTAGMRQSDDCIEQMGIQQILNLLPDVDLVIYLNNVTDPSDVYPELNALPGERWFEVSTKCDLTDEVVECSIRVGADGDLERLVQEIVVRLSAPVSGHSVWVTNQRQAELLEAATALVQQAQEDLKHGFGDEIVSTALNHVRSVLGEITGETTVEDILDRMFSDFCLGK